jgi:hypothetical protein
VFLKLSTFSLPLSQRHFSKSKCAPPDGESLSKQSNRNQWTDLLTDPFFPLFSFPKTALACLRIMNIFDPPPERNGESHPLDCFEKEGRKKTKSAVKAIHVCDCDVMM